ncbi:MAG: oligosaccharide flippase family protein [Pseudomonadota bacterium]
MLASRLSDFRAFVSGKSLKRRALRSSIWTFFGAGAQYSLRLVSTLFLTRLLDPEAFGLMSLATVFMLAIGLMSDIGTTPSIIRSSRGEDAVFLRTAWTIQAIRGVLITIIACSLAWPVAQFYGQLLLFPMICLLSLTALIKGFTSIAEPLARRAMALRKLTKIDLITQIVTTLLTIGSAWALESVWALVIGALIGSVLRLFLTYKMLDPFAHSFGFERKALSEIVVFGRWILLGTFLTFLGGEGIQAVFGILVPVDVLGMIAIAHTLGWALGDLMKKVLGNVAFPALSEVIRDRPQDAPRVLRQIQLMLITGCLPIFILLSVVAQDLIDLMYDHRYAQAGVFLSILALNGAMGTLSMPYQSALLAAGESRLHAIVMGLAAGLRIIAVFVGFHFAGVVGMLAALGAATALVFLVSATFAHRRGMASLPIDSIALVLLGVAYVVTLPYAIGS